ncbi:hypothetical protein CD30_07420 [Ureibacillus massiliensis 4400831 = CIP 108448 = CCUG 49529]|uniref:Lipoprotein n=2 Tax=Ureibacillus massiliensis TaxID=292806 RepID=A0A0A3J6C9_9BACL|nr:hypothetical protein CD30_07420 [Ureibacillus massiliensis 4400831 = CIP 108448 = CCUG 49529]
MEELIIRNLLQLLLLILLLLVVGCSNNVFQDNITITSIEIMKFKNSPPTEEYYNEEGEVISVITSEEEISKIIKSIEGAESESLENANIALPNYMLIFKNNGEKVKSLGYNPDVESKDYFYDISEDMRYKTNPIKLMEKYK